MADEYDDRCHFCGAGVDFLRDPHSRVTMVVRRVAQPRAHTVTYCGACTERFEPSFQRAAPEAMEAARQRPRPGGYRGRRKGGEADA